MVVETRPSNGGDLRTGNPGNAGGPGRPPSALRATCRASFAARIKILEDIADGEPVVKLRGMDGETTIGHISASPADRLKAIDLLGKYAGIEYLAIEAPSARSAIAGLPDRELLRVQITRYERWLALESAHALLHGSAAHRDAG